LEKKLFNLNHMKIACIGWGSLIWRPENLAIQKKWFEDGPMLPIEFTRISDDGRVTLIIDKDAKPVRTLWAFMTVTDIDKAIISLKEREKIQNLKKIEYVKSTDTKTEEVEKIIIDWLNSKSLDYAIWTGLSFGKKTISKRPTIETILRHLEQLPYGIGQRAEEYIRNAPKQIDTEYRREIENKLGWTCLPEK